MALSLKKIKFKQPPKCDLVCFHDSGAFNFNFLKKKYNVAIFSTSKNIYVSPRIILNCFFYLKHINTKRKYFGLATIYHAACMRAMQAKIVFTFIDNSGLFHRLTRIYKHAEYFAVQNSHKCVLHVKEYLPKNKNHPASVITSPNFFCFSQYEIDLYNRYKHSVQNYIPVGSLRVDLFMSQYPQLLHNQEHYDICRISQTPSPELMQWDNLAESLLLSDYFFARFLRENPSIKACIALRTGDEAEQRYYRKIYGNRVKLTSGNNISDMGAYKAAYASKVTYTTASTLGLEMLGIGKKILYSCFFDTLATQLPYSCSHHDWSDFISEFVCQQEDYDVFQRMLFNVLEMPLEEFRKRTQKVREYFYEARGPGAQKAIMSFIDKHLGGM